MTRGQLRRGNGQFAGTVRFEVDVDLGGDLDAAVRSPDPDVRADVAVDPRVSDEQLAELCRPSQPLRVRLAAVRSRRPLALDLLTSDPDPFVRWHACMASGAPMDPGVREFAAALSLHVPD